MSAATGMSRVLQMNGRFLFAYSGVFLRWTGNHLAHSSVMDMWPITAPRRTQRTRTRTCNHARSRPPARTGGRAASMTRASSSTPPYRAPRSRHVSESRCRPGFRRVPGARRPAGTCVIALGGVPGRSRTTHRRRARRRVLPGRCPRPGWCRGGWRCVWDSARPRLRWPRWPSTPVPERRIREDHTSKPGSGAELGAGGLPVKRPRRHRRRRGVPQVSGLAPPWGPPLGARPRRPAPSCTPQRRAPPLSARHPRYPRRRLEPRRHRQRLSPLVRGQPRARRCASSDRPRTTRCT